MWENLSVSLDLSSFKISGRINLKLFKLNKIFATTCRTCEVLQCRVLSEIGRKLLASASHLIGAVDEYHLPVIAHYISNYFGIATSHMYRICFPDLRNIDPILQFLNNLLVVKVSVGDDFHACSAQTSQWYLVPRCCITFSTELIVCLSLSAMSRAWRVMEGKRAEMESRLTARRGQVS